MSDSVRPHRRQPTRLRRPWDSLGKNTGVGCHFLLQCMKVISESEAAQSRLTLCDPIDSSYQAPLSMGFSRQEYWSAYHCLLWMLKQKLQYFGHLMQRVNSFEKTLMRGKFEGGRKRGQQKMRWLDGITDSMDLSWLWTWRPGVLQSMGSRRVRHD